MKVTAYVSHSDCSRHDPGWGYADHQGRLPAVARAVYRDMLTLFDPLLELEGVPASEEDLLLVHTPGYLDRIRAAVAAAAVRGEAVEAGAEVRVSGASWEAAVAAVGCALTAVDAVMRGEVRNAFCATRPPGAGAGPDFGSRFALFNPIAVAARHLQERRGAGRVLVVECGAVEGAGTAAALLGLPAVRMLSLHAAGPGERPEGVVRAPLAAGSGGAEALDALRTGLDRALDGFAPDFVLLSLGCDLLASDPLGALAVEPADLYGLTGEIRALADRACSGRLVSVLEGGYDPQGTGSAVVQHLRALARLPAA